MGNKPLVFGSKAAEYAQSLPAPMPQYPDAAGLVVAAGVNANLPPLHLEFNGFATDVESPRLEAGSESYTASLVAQHPQNC